MIFLKKNKDLSNLFSKKIKLESKKFDFYKLISEKTKLMTETENQLDEIEKTIFHTQLKDFFIRLDLLYSILKKEKNINFDGILQSCSKYSKNIFEFKGGSTENSIDTTVCTCDGRMNVCIDTENCPIDWKAKCDGVLMSAAFFKRNINENK